MAKPQLETLSKKRTEQLRVKPAFRWAEDLLKKSIFITKQDDEVLEGEIITVEAFTENAGGKQDDRRFREKEREQGEVIIYDRYGNPMLGIVVNGDAEKQETIWIKELRVINPATGKGKKMKFTAFLKEAGLDPKDLQHILDVFDGAQAYHEDPDSPLFIDNPQQAVQNTRAGIQEAVRNAQSVESLGEFHKG